MGFGLSLSYDIVVKGHDITLTAITEVGPFSEDKMRLILGM